MIDSVVSDLGLCYYIFSFWGKGKIEILIARICLLDMKVPELVQGLEGYGVYLIWGKNDKELSREVCLAGWLPLYILIDFNVKETLG